MSDVNFKKRITGNTYQAIKETRDGMNGKCSLVKPFTFSLQHALVMYAGAIAVLPMQCRVACIRLLAIMSVTFVAVPAMIITGDNSRINMARIRILPRVNDGTRHHNINNDNTHKYNLHIVAISLVVGITSLFFQACFKKLPNYLKPLLHSGIMLSTVSALILNLYFNGDTSEEDESQKDNKGVLSLPLNLRRGSDCPPLELK